jgi:hypothetical protein
MNTIIQIIDLNKMFRIKIDKLSYYNIYHIIISMYLSDFNMMLDNKLVDCFSETSLDKTDKTKISNEMNQLNYSKNDKKLKEKIICNSINNIYGKEDKRLIERDRINGASKNRSNNDTGKFKKSK